ncbi:spermatid-specific manchette-related protein 1 [Gracilinanus agilis]|uniref:spermatid-specific manchette-related protein 1 n=1 Tax=Gracilinanus agilis TaxID=191870 RepID=UPI001CFD096C|nr:spermatid-specific manchette-related protein 1 [Gracilinanus agilis]
MFLFAHKTKTPISTYTDSYRAPSSIKQDYKDPPLWAWEENKFVSPGLKKPMLEQHVDQQSLEKMVKRAVEEYSYKGSVPGNPYLPQKYWISEAEAERYNPAFISGDRYGAWRTAPYNSTGWNKYTTYLPRLPKEAGMETMMRGMPLDYPPKPDRFNNYEREVVVNMLNSLSRNQLPSIQPRYTVPGRLPFQGYDSPCTGRHYCLRGMDYYATGAPSNERHLTQTTRTQDTLKNVPLYSPRPGMTYAVSPHLPPSHYPYTNLRWDSSHFKLIGGPQRNNFIIHPEFVSETYPIYRCW